MKKLRGILHTPLRPLLRPVVRSPFQRGSGGFSPSQINFTSGLWLDPSDIATGFQDSAGTTPQTASGQPTGKRLDKSGRGNHVLQAAGGFRPEYDLISAIASDFFDGSDDKLVSATFSAGTLTANMDCFVAIKRADAASGEIVGSANGDYFGFYSSGSATAAAFGTGSPSGFVNGVALPGTTAGDLHTALTSGTWKVLEYRGLDLSDWTDIRISEIDFIAADIGGVILCPAQSTLMRNNLRTWLGRKVGLSL